MIETKEQYEAWVVSLGQQEEMPPEVKTIEALRDVAKAAKTYRDSHTMEGANKEGELLMDFTARIVAERARIDETLAALPAWITENA